VPTPPDLNGGARNRAPEDREDEGLGSADLRTYALLSRLGFPRGYGGKIMLVAFLGTHVPLIALVLYLLIVPPGGLAAHLGVLASLVAATLLGFVATSWALRGMLSPIRLASRALKGYLDDGRMPDLPLGFGDEAGRLMANVRYAIDNLDSTVRSLEGLSGIDHLSGLLNRREAEKRLAEDAARARRGEGVLTAVLVDINQFKSVNDTYGHQAGDACIRHVARVVRHNIREGDWLARWGGDEFLLVLHDASPFAPTEEILRRIVGALKANPLRLPQGKEVVLTVSVGATRYSGEEDPRRALVRADEAMYEAKREGRSWVLAN
jgi:diguanylate cyclase (GGDEF)-like protein